MTNTDEELFDPTTWDWLDNEPEYRIYLDDNCERYALVDYVDYVWAVRWRWSIKWSRGNRKCYAYRTDNSNGNHGSLFLHIAIMERTGIPRPPWDRVLCDHRNGRSLDCRRCNLRWASTRTNRLNLHGAYPVDLVDG